MRRRVPRLLMAMAACLAVVVLWLLAPGKPRAAQAFNMFAETLVGARSATFQMEVSIEGQAKQKLQSYYLAPGKIRNEMKGIVSIVDMKTGKIVTLLPEQKMATVMNMQNMPAGKPQFNDFFERTRDLLSKSRDAKDDEFERLGAKEIDGRQVIGFRYASPLQSMTLWGDPATGLPVLIETVLSGFLRTEVAMSHFELNTELKPALFDTTPPGDYKVQAFDVDASTPTEATLIEGLRVATDLNDGMFIAALDTASTQALVARQVLRDMKDKSKDVTPEVMKLAMTVGRGMLFALELPESADAHYAGKGIKRGEPDRPIFWYKPAGETKYRVIYADLTAKDADRAPEVAGAVRLQAPKSPRAE